MQAQSINYEKKAIRFGHFVLRSKRYKETLDWYIKFFQAEIEFQNSRLTFLSWDEEHHRLAIADGSLTLDEKEEAAGGVDHIAFGLDTLYDLMDTFERLRSEDINPYRCINHGMSTSLYFQDPDGVKIEYQVENYPEPEQAKAFLRSPEFEKDWIGIDFDPDELFERLRSGKEKMEDLLIRADVPR